MAANDGLRRLATVEWNNLERVLNSFETAWRQGPRPSLDDFLAQEPALRTPLLIELVHLDLEYRLKAGEGAHPEDYLARYPELAENRDALRRHGDGLRHAPPTAVLTAAELLSVLRRYQLLEPQRLDDSAGTVQANVDARALAKNLIDQGSLTPYQANQLLQGHGQDLVLGSYVLLERLGEGGMGQVFKARHRALNRVCAIKLIRKERLKDSAAIRRFQREVRAAAQLNHPNVVLAYDADEIAGTHLLVMEYVEGATDLARLVKQRGPLPVEAACDYIRQATLGLQHAHERGLVHRDIKPHNLVVSGVRNQESGVSKGDAVRHLTPDSWPLTPVVKVLDLGLARLDSSTADGESTSTLTREGSVMGTPDFISPEQVKESHTVDIRGDIYSLGCTFYYLLTGRVPFPGGNLGEKLVKHIMDEPTPVEQLRPEVSPGVAAVVRKMMAKKLEDRYQAPVEVAAVLADGVPLLASGARGSGGDTIVVKAPTLEAAAVHRFVREEEHRRRWRRNRIGGGILLGMIAVLAIIVRQSWPRQVAEIPRRDQQAPSSPLVDAPRPITNSVGMTLVYIPAGEFTMGSPASEAGRYPQEGPQHQVRITRGFYMGSCEVRQCEYEKVIGKMSGFRDDPDFPVNSITWTEAVAFCEKLSDVSAEKNAGRRYRLPREAEWEYACRAGSTAAFSFGDSLSWTQANIIRTPAAENDKRIGFYPVKVSSYPANNWGLHDMHGNVWEWCLDGPREYQRDAVVDPEGPLAPGTDCITRGGGYGCRADVCRSALRKPEPPSRRGGHLGFRVLCEHSPAGTDP